MSLGYGQGAGAYQNMHARGGVETADPHKLVAMLLDGALERIALARGHMERGEIARKGEMLGRCTDIVSALRDALDHEVDAAFTQRMDDLYDYITRRLLYANLHNDTAALDEAANLLRPIRDSWQQIPEEARRQARPQR